MQKNSKNWIKVDPEILGFSSISYQQRLKGIKVSHTEAYIKCIVCNHEKKIDKVSNERRWDLKGWQACLEKPVVGKDDRGYFITSPVRFYCACNPCVEAIKIMALN